MTLPVYTQVAPLPSPLPHYSAKTLRSYKPNPVEDDKLQQVLEAARLAPTAANRQPFQLIVMRTAGRQAELRRIYQREWLARR